MTYAAFLSAPHALRPPRSLLSRLEMGFDSSSFVEASAATTSLVNSLAMDVAATTSSSSKEFEPILPDTSALLGITAVLIVSAAAGWVWANQVVPTSRTKLALSKRQGDVKEYLEGLEQAAPEDERQFEQWLFTDWLEQREAKGTTSPGRQKEPAIPVLKKAKWNSGDNPILAATALILLGVTFGAIVEQASSILT